MGPKNNYIDEKILIGLIEEWKIDKDNGKNMSDELGRLIVLIGEGICKKSKYNKIPKDDLHDVLYDSIVNCLKYCHKFEVKNSKSKHPAFTYLTFVLERGINSSLQTRNKKAIPTIYLTFEE